MMIDMNKHLVSFLFTAWSVCPVLVELCVVVLLMMRWLPQVEAPIGAMRMFAGDSLRGNAESAQILGVVLGRQRGHASIVLGSALRKALLPLEPIKSRVGR